MALEQSLAVLRHTCQRSTQTENDFSVAINTSQNIVNSNQQRSRKYMSGWHKQHWWKWKDVERGRETDRKGNRLVTVCYLNFTPVGWNEHSVMELADWGLCVSVCVCVLRGFLSHRYCGYPEAIQKTRQVDTAPAPVLTTHQFLHTVEPAHDQPEPDQAVIFLCRQTCLSF